MNFSENASHVDTFRLGDKFFEHHIFCSEDDRIECTDEDGKVILTFTANCDVLGTDLNSIGRWHTRDYNWYFETHEGKQFHYGRNLLKAEVEVSKLYIQGMLHGQG